MKLTYCHTCINKHGEVYMAGAWRHSLRRLNADLVYHYDTMILGYEITCGGVTVYNHVYRKPRVPKRVITRPEGVL
jgi:hypothetical protein